MRGKRSKVRFLIFWLVFLTLNVSQAQKVNNVVLDAGHGGHDTGALGRQSREKDIALSIVLKLRDYIVQNMSDVKVILTRSDDNFVELYRRAKIANENKADLFISVHCNSTKSPAAYGVETFVMGLHKSDANLAVAKAENAAILLEDDYVEKYDGFDPASPEGNIFFSMIQNAFLDHSLDLAGNVQRQLVNNLNLYNRGVKQAGFLVLYKTAMPSVLIETGFISNPTDEKYLLSEKGQSNIAMAIFTALKNYRASVEKTGSVAQNPKEVKPAVQETASPVAQPRQENKPVQQEPVKITAANNNTAPTAAKESKNSPPAQASSETLPPAAGNTDNTQASTGKPVAVRKEVTVPEPERKVPAETITYRVQFASSPTAIPLKSSEFRNTPDVWQYFHNGLYKYTSGSFGDIIPANEHRARLIKAGFKDAFIVVFKGDNRISIEEAKSILEKKQ